MRAEWGVLFLGAALLFPCQAGVDARRGLRPDVVQTLPPQRLLPVLAFGHGETLADLLEIQATNFLIERLERFDRMDRDHLWRLYGAIVALDPQNAGAYWRGAVYMASLADRPDAALELLDRGLGEGADAGEAVHSRHPDRWLLYHEKAAIHLMMLASRAPSEEERQAHVREAGRLLILASEQPAAPPRVGGYGRVGRSLVQRGRSRLEGLELEAAMWEERTHTGDEVMRARARERLAEARAALLREHLQQAVDRRAAEGAPVSSLDALGGAPPDPLGVGFLLIDGRVAAPGLEARELERLLVMRFARWRRERPSGLPTLTELGVADLAPYLEAEVTPEGVEVRPRRP